MNKPILVPMPGNEDMARSVAQRVGGSLAFPEMRSFPDGETYFRIDADVCARDIVLICTLDHVDAKFLPLIFAADTLRDLGASRIGLVAPYLAYMRQDRRFQSGEAISSRIFASALSPHIDWLVTVDPHLHRLHSLKEIFSVPSRVLHASPQISAWIEANVTNPLLIGPDSESAQWLSDVAQEIGAPSVVLEKIRKGDRNVEVSLPDVHKWREYTPVLLDDIISTGRTMIEALNHMRQENLKPAVCIAVHAIFAPATYESLLAAQPARVVTANTVRHPTNAIDVSGVLATSICENFL